MRISHRTSRFAESALIDLNQLRHDPLASRDGIVRSVSITEIYIDAVIEKLIAREIHSGSPAAQYSLNAAMRTVNQTWDSRKDLLAKGFRSELNNGCWQNLRVVVEARNALAHGNGMLTDRQTASTLKAIRLKCDLLEISSISVSGRRLITTKHSLLACVNICETFILDIERTTRNA